MQVSVESTGTLDRRMTVRFPAERVTQEVDKRLVSLSRKIRLDGFRPGKVPVRVVQQRYGAGVFQEVLGEVIEATYREAIAQEGLQPAGGPKIEAGQSNPGEPLEYVAAFQIFPEVELADLTAIAIDRPRVEIETADVDRVIESLRRQQKTWREASRPAQEGDRVTLDFAGTLDGEAFEGGKAEGMAIEVGAGRLLADFENQLVGLEAAGEKTIDVTFPEDYPAEPLKGRTAQFALKVQKVEEPVLPEVDAEFARSFGIDDGDIERLRSEVGANMARELAQTVKNRLKKQVMDALHDLHLVDLPEAAVTAEVERLREDARKRFGQGGQAREMPDLPMDLFRAEAERRVRLGLVMRAILKKDVVKLDSARVEEELDQIAQTYEYPEEIKRHYRANAEALSALESMVLEDQVVDWIISQAKVTETHSSFDDLMNAGRPAVT
jgi:trigger factor